MSVRGFGASLAAIGIVVFALLRPDAPTAGSDCEVLSGGPLREPVAALSSLAIVGAGWVLARGRPATGTAVLLAGAASFAAHATAHPTARALDGITATTALLTVLWSIGRATPDRRRLTGGILVAAAGVAVWILGRSDGPFCDDLGAWGHAAWHVLVASAALITLWPRPKAPTQTDSPPTLILTNGPS